MIFDMKSRRFRAILDGFLLLKNRILNVFSIGFLLKIMKKFFRKYNDNQISLKIKENWGGESPRKNHANPKVAFFSDLIKNLENRLKSQIFSAKSQKRV